MRISCPTCRATVPAADINIQAMSALCRSCNEIFVIEAPADTPAAPGPTPGLPSRFQLDEAGAGRWTVSWRWWQWGYLFLLFFCVAWDSFLVFWYAMAIAGLGKTGAFSLIAFIFPIAHVAVGVGLTYFVVAGICNRTRVSCDGDLLTVHHGPVPWFGNRTIPLRDLGTVRIDVSYSRRGPTKSNLVAVVDGKDVTLLSDLEHREAEWLRHRLQTRR